MFKILTIVEFPISTTEIAVSIHLFEVEQIPLAENTFELISISTNVVLHKLRFTVTNDSSESTEFIPKSLFFTIIVFELPIQVKVTGVDKEHPETSFI